ncbi:DUF177 domain-containing protein [Chloroflexota bacterium]
MEINVSQLLKAPVGTTREYDMDSTVDIADDGNGCLVQGKIKLIRTQRGILVRAALSTGVALTCGRCLSLFRCPLSLDFEEEYVPIVDVVTGTPLPLPKERSTFTIDEHHVLDLTEATRQYSVLVIPMKPLCREECVGLCPSCGHNLNQGPCDCPSPEIDPRWTKFAEFKKQR